MNYNLIRPKLKATNLNIGNRPIVELIYPRKAGAGYTRFDITSLIDIQKAKYA